MKMLNRKLPLLVVTCSLLFACATVAKGPDDLDIAIRDTSDYLNDNLPKGSKIVILNIQSDHAALSDYIIDELIANAVNDKIFSVVDRAQLEQIRMELNFQMSGEVDDNSALEIGKFLGAQTIVSGAISELADRHRMRIRALNVQTAEVQGQYNRNISASKLITALMKGGKSQSTSYGTARVGGGTSSAGKQAAQAKTPAKPKDGTYTFFPRIRATNAGLPINCYLHKIEVKGKYLIVYQSGDARIASGRGAPGYWYITYNVILTDLDNPTKTWQPTSHQDNVGGTGYEALSFENVTAARFSLECSWYGQNIYEEIILGEPDE
ncbi:MAG: CsgG/HfaB family protein [Treponema sp.]|nr:CsgG/HfaB family protein [Treponema sp.]